MDGAVIELSNNGYTLTNQFLYTILVKPLRDSNTHSRAFRQIDYIDDLYRRDESFSSPLLT